MASAVLHPQPTTRHWFYFCGYGIVLEPTTEMKDSKGDPVANMLVFPDENRRPHPGRTLADNWNYSEVQEQFRNYKPVGVAALHVPPDFKYVQLRLTKKPVDGVRVWRPHEAKTDGSVIMQAWGDPYTEMSVQPDSLDQPTASSRPNCVPAKAFYTRLTEAERDQLKTGAAINVEVWRFRNVLQPNVGTFRQATVVLRDGLRPTSPQPPT